MEVLKGGLFLTILFCNFHNLLGSSQPNDENSKQNAEFVRMLEPYLLPLRQEMERMQSEHNRDMANLREEIRQIRGSHEIEIENLRQEFENKMANCKACLEDAANKIAKGKNKLSDISKPGVMNAENLFTFKNETTMVQGVDNYETATQRSFYQLRKETPGNITNDGSVNIKDEKTLKDEPTTEGRRLLMANGQRIRRDITGHRVAFFAKLSAHATGLGINQPLLFDNVVTNYGGGYDKNTGAFRAPVSGVYLFSVTITTYKDNSGHFGIFVNQNRMTLFYLNGAQNSYDETSQTIIVYLAAADDVTVRSIGESNKGALGQEHSVFSGTLLFEVSEQSVVIGK